MQNVPLDDEALIERDREDNDKFRHAWFFFFGKILPTAVALAVIAISATVLHYLG